MAGNAAAKVETPAVETATGDDEFKDAFAMFSNDKLPDVEKVVAVEPDAAPVVLGADGKPLPENKTLGTGEPEIKSEIVDAPIEGETAEQKTAREAAAGKTGDIVIGKPDAKDDKVSDVLERLVDVLGSQQKQTGETTQRQTGDGTAPPLYTNQELEVLAGFAKEWPEVAQAQAVLMNGLAKSIEARIYSEIARGMAPHIRQLGVLVNNAQYDDVSRRVPGYDQVMDKVGEWVNSQSVGYLKKAQLGVIEGGTAEEIEHLVGEYRKATGDTTGVPAANQNQQTEDKTALSPAVKKAMVRLAPVVSKISGAVAGEPQTFDSGFDHALKLLEKTG